MRLVRDWNLSLDPRCCLVQRRIPRIVGDAETFLFGKSRRIESQRLKSARHHSIIGSGSDAGFADFGAYRLTRAQLAETGDRRNYKVVDLKGLR